MKKFILFLFLFSLTAAAAETVPEAVNQLEEITGQLESELSDLDAGSQRAQVLTYLMEFIQIHKDQGIAPGGEEFLSIKKWAEENYFDLESNAGHVILGLLYQAGEERNERLSRELNGVFESLYGKTGISSELYVFLSDHPGHNGVVLSKELIQKFHLYYIEEEPAVRGDEGISFLPYLGLNSGDMYRLRRQVELLGGDPVRWNQLLFIRNLSLLDQYLIEWSAYAVSENSDLALVLENSASLFQEQNKRKGELKTALLYIRQISTVSDITHEESKHIEECVDIINTIGRAGTFDLFYSDPGVRRYLVTLTDSLTEESPLYISELADRAGISEAALRSSVNIVVGAEEMFHSPLFLYADYVRSPRYE